MVSCGLGLPVYCGSVSDEVHPLQSDITPVVEQRSVRNTSKTA